MNVGEIGPVESDLELKWDTLSTEQIKGLIEHGQAELARRAGLSQNSPAFWPWLFYELRVIHTNV